MGENLASGDVKNIFSFSTEASSLEILNHDEDKVMKNKKLMRFQGFYSLTAVNDIRTLDLFVLGSSFIY